MEIMIFQVMAVIVLAAFALAAWITLGMQHAPEADGGEVLWTILAARTGTARRTVYNWFLPEKSMRNQIGLPKGTLIIGNRPWDELYMDSTGPRVQMLANVQEDYLYISVLQGSINIGGCEYKSNCRSRLGIPDYTRIRMEDMELLFERKR